MRCAACNAAIEYTMESLCSKCLAVVSDVNKDLIEKDEVEEGEDIPY